MPSPFTYTKSKPKLSYYSMKLDLNDLSEIAKLKLSLDETAITVESTKVFEGTSLEYQVATWCSVAITMWLTIYLEFTEILS